MDARLTRQVDGVGWATGGVVTSLLIEPFRRTIGLENVTIVYLATVVLTAAFGGRAARLFTPSPPCPTTCSSPRRSTRSSSTRSHRSSPSDCYWPPVLPPAWPDTPGVTSPSPSTSRSS
jgi:hypothetical protein